MDEIKAYVILEMIKNRLKSYQDISTHPVLNDLGVALSHISTLEEKVKEADLRHQEDNSVIGYWCHGTAQAESRIRELEDGIKEVIGEWNNDRIMARYGEGKDALLGLKKLLEKE